MLGEDPVELGLKGHEQEFIRKLRPIPFISVFSLKFSGPARIFIPFTT